MRWKGYRQFPAFKFLQGGPEPVIKQGILYDFGISRHDTSEPSSAHFSAHLDDFAH